MKYMVILALFLGACTSREACVNNAKAEYRQNVSVCADAGKSYDECNKDYKLEQEFQEKQEACRGF